MSALRAWMHARYPQKPLVLMLSLLSISVLFFLDFLPVYTKFALAFLVVPSIFILFRRGEHIDERRLGIVLLFSLIATIIWDTVAMNTWLWNFPHESVSFTILRIPVEEYIWGLWFPITVIGIYTSLPRLRPPKVPMLSMRFSEFTLKAMTFVLQIMVTGILLRDPANYLAWVAMLALIPSLFILFRKGEHVDEMRLMLTLAAIIAIVVVMDLVFIPAGAWYYNPDSLLGTIGIIPIDDFLFGIFNAILIIGFYTSIPRGNIWKNRW